MNEIIESIEKRITELDKQFKEIKDKLINAENFVVKAKEELISLSGSYKELVKLRDELVKSDEKKSEGENDGE